MKLKARACHLLVLLLTAAAAPLKARVLTDSRRGLIVGGQPSSNAAQFPYMCSLRSKRSGRHLCGATLLAPRLALTAAYCVSPPNGVVDPLLFCGLRQLYDQELGTYDELHAVQTIVNAAYRAATYCSDVALLELNASTMHGVPIAGTIQPGEFAYREGYPFTALGWGFTEASNGNVDGLELPPDVLQYADLPFIPLPICNAPGTYAGRVEADSMFCAGRLDGSADTCAGDSGGPLVDRHGSSNPADHRQAGIVSWGAGCARPGWPGVYSRLDAFAGFILGQGYCGCTSTGQSGGTPTTAAGCSAAIAQAELHAGWQPPPNNSVNGSSIAACYVVDPERCSYSGASQLFPGAGLALCNSDTNLTIAQPGLLAPPLVTESSGGGASSAAAADAHRLMGPAGPPPNCLNACSSSCQLP